MCLWKGRDGVEDRKGGRFVVVEKPESWKHSGVEDEVLALRCSKGLEQRAGENLLRPLEPAGSIGWRSNMVGGGRGSEWGEVK
jgi:hypothetical protein